MKTNQINKEEIEDLEKDKTRIEKILSLLCLDHLNEEEKISITSLVTKHAERFHLPGKALGTTSVLRFEFLQLMIARLMSNSIKILKSIKRRYNDRSMICSKKV